MVGGPSITTPIERSKGFHYCLVSYHKDRAALDQYQASPEHHLSVNLGSSLWTQTNDARSVTSKYMWPFNEDLMRFDFETDGALPPSTLGPLIDSQAASPARPSPNFDSSREDSPAR